MNPCCGGSLKIGTKFIALLHMGFWILIVSLGVIMLMKGGDITSSSQSAHEEIAEKSNSSIIDSLTKIILLPVHIGGIMFGSFLTGIGMLLIIVGIFYFLLASLLWNGANMRSTARCMIWFVLNLISLMCPVLINLMGIYVGVKGGSSENGESESTKGPLIVISIFTVVVLIDSYHLWVVWAFMAEVRKEVSVAKSEKSRLQASQVESALLSEQSVC